MREPTQRDLLREIHQVVIGLPDNPEANGLIGDMAEIKQLLVTQNGSIRENAKNIALNVVKISSIEKCLDEGVAPKFSKKQYTAGGMSVATLITTLVITLGKAMGWF